MASYLNAKGADYRGIINGVDYDVWNPATDRLIPARYSPDQAMAGKALCKQKLQRRPMLEVDPDVRLIGVVSRLSLQKWLDLLAHTVERIVADLPGQFAILGSGAKDLEWYFGPLPGLYPHPVGAWPGQLVGIAQPATRRRLAR